MENGSFVDSLEATFNPIVARVACSGGVLGDVTYASRHGNDIIRPRILGCPSAKWTKMAADRPEPNTTPTVAEIVKPQID